MPIEQMGEQPSRGLFLIAFSRVRRDSVRRLRAKRGGPLLALIEGLPAVLRHHVRAWVMDVRPVPVAAARSPASRASACVELQSSALYRAIVLRSVRVESALLRQAQARAALGAERRARSSRGTFLWNP